MPDLKQDCDYDSLVAEGEVQFNLNFVLLEVLELIEQSAE